MHGLAERHKRKRNTTPVEENKIKWFKLLDRLTLVAGVIGPMTDIPQILKLLITRNAAGVSVLAWSGTLVLDIPFILYGLAHKDRPIVTTYSLWFTGNIVVLALTLLYSHGSYL